MQRKRPPIPVIILIIIAVLVGGYYGIRALSGGTNGALAASGSIEATMVNVSPEMTGKVKEVLVQEGQAVKEGDTLVGLDDTLLQEQRKVAMASLDSATAGSQTAQTALMTAQDQYQIALEAALAQDQKTRLQDWFKKDPKQFDQPGWYFSRAEQIQAAQTQVDAAKKALDDAQANLTKMSSSLGSEDFLKAEERLLNARLSYLIKQDVNNRAQNSTDADIPVGRYNRTHCGTNEGYHLDNSHITNLVYGCIGDENLSDVGQALYDAAQAELDEAQLAYNDLLSSQAAQDVLNARAQVAVTQEQYYIALDELRKLQTGEQSPSVTAAQSMVVQAQAAYDQSQKAIEQAKANISLLDAQIAKLTVFAPMDGVILTRNVEPGEFVQPGATALTMADLSNITITVYVPEDRYGQIKLGQQAEFQVDSFPGETFNAEVIHIADQAEFTPRNVQTVEGRSSTVYAIKLKVINTEGKLKIGMPADVVFK